MGIYQDAGILRNNSISIILIEAENQFSFAEESDLVLSLGTEEGSSNSESPKRPKAHSLIKDGCLPRSFRAFSEIMRDKRDW